MPRIPEDADRDFVANCYIVDDGQVLLIDHRKLDMWLPPGGHVEPRETPDETAKREAREETGITVTFHDVALPPAAPDESENLPQPFRCNLHRIRDGHWHCEFAYLATVADTADATHPEEHRGTRWFGKDKLARDRVPGNVRQAAREALELAGTT